MKRKWYTKQISHPSNMPGGLSVAELGAHFDFKVERIFYLQGIKEGEVRGNHAHEELSQFILCLAGSFLIEMDDGGSKEQVQMTANGIGLFVDGLVWRKMWQFSSDAVMLVLCDRIYEQDLVITDYSKFKQLASESRA